MRLLENPPYKVSILVPVYKVERYIRRCAVSLFAQTYTDIEYIFVDDCSPDRSIDVLKEVMEEFPQRKGSVRILHNEANRGVAATRNVMDCHATGEFVMSVDSDDWIDHDTVEKCVAKQIEGDYDIVKFEMLLEWNEGNLRTSSPLCKNKKEAIIQILKGGWSHRVPAHLIRRDLIVMNHICFREGYNMAEDYSYISKLFYYAEKICVLPEALYHYDYTNESSMVHGFSMEKAEQAWRNIEDVARFFSDKEECFRNAVKFYQAEHICSYMQKSLKFQNDKYYDICRERLKKMDMRIIMQMELRNRIIVLLRFKWLQQFYVDLLTPIYRWYKFQIKLR